MLKFLGRGSAFNIKEGNTSAYIKDNGVLFLIDCGSNIFERILKSNILEGVEDVYVAITHPHPDHVGSLGDFIFYCYYKLGITVNLYEIDDNLGAMLYLGGVSNQLINNFDGNIPKIGLKLNHIEADHQKIFELKPSSGVNSNGIMLEYENMFFCYSFIIEYNGKKAFYSGDCSTVDFKKIGEIDIYYIETCSVDYKENVHYYIENLYKDCILNNIELSTVRCMHVDSDEVIERAKQIGFYVVENEFSNHTLESLY